MLIVRKLWYNSTVDTDTLIHCIYLQDRDMNLKVSVINYLNKEVHTKDILKGSFCKHIFINFIISSECMPFQFRCLKWLQLHLNCSYIMWTRLVFLFSYKLVCGNEHICSLWNSFLVSQWILHINMQIIIWNKHSFFIK